MKKGSWKAGNLKPPGEVAEKEFTPGGYFSYLARHTVRPVPTNTVYSWTVCVSSYRTYRPEITLKVTEQDGHLILSDLEKGKPLAEHRLCKEKGQLIQNRNHLRDHSARVEELFEATLALLGTTEQAAALLTGIRREKRRYVRDQFKLMQKTAAEQPQEALEKAIVYCLERKIYSAVDCRDAALWFSQQPPEGQTDVLPDVKGMPAWLNVKTDKRSPAACYGHLAGGES